MTVLEEQVWKHLQGRKEADSLQHIAVVVQASESVVSATLLSLELRGLTRRLPGNNFVALKTRLPAEVRTLSEIAAEIERDWRKQPGGVYFAARPYLTAMGALTAISQMYGADEGCTVVAYFLANAQTWRGEVARRIKKELNAMLKAEMKRSKP